MEKNNDQLKIEYVEAKKVSSLVKYISIVLILIFTFIPLAEFIDVLDYNYAAPHTFHICLVDWHYEPLQFKSLPLSN